MTSRLCAASLPGVLLLASLACSSAPPPQAGEGVRVTTHESEVEKCSLRGDVEVRPPYRGPRDAERILQNEAAKLGGDVVLTRGYSGTMTIIQGKAYKCGGKADRRR
jgi:hypothetical protein